MKITINSVLVAVLIYPLLLFFPSLFNVEAFFITAPYFFTLLLLIFGSFLLKQHFKITNRINVIVVLIGILAISAIINFSTIRYSSPLFFTVYTFFFYLFLGQLNDKRISLKILQAYFYLMIILSVPFLFLKQGYTEADRFTGFIGSPTIYSGFLFSIFIITFFKKKIWSFHFIAFFVITLYLIYLTKTRLLLILMMIYPVLRLLSFKKRWATRKLYFFVFYFTTLLIYPLYDFVTTILPGLVTLRYEDREDTSFGLRNYLYEELKEVYLNGSMYEKILGRGNEFSRIYVDKLMGFDLLPHNDYMRLLVDWGLIGMLVFSVLLYKVATRNDLCMYLSLVYMVLFYSNTIFNLFLISILIIFYYGQNDKPLSQYMGTIQFDR